MPVLGIVSAISTLLQAHQQREVQRKVSRGKVTFFLSKGEKDELRANLNLQTFRDILTRRKPLPSKADPGFTTSLLDAVIFGVEAGRRVKVQLPKDIRRSLRESFGGHPSQAKQLSSKFLAEAISGIKLDIAQPGVEFGPISTPATLTAPAELPPVTFDFLAGAFSGPSPPPIQPQVVIQTSVGGPSNIRRHSVKPFVPFNPGAPTSPPGQFKKATTNGFFGFFGHNGKHQLSRGIVDCDRESIFNPFGTAVCGGRGPRSGVIPFQ